MWFIQFGPHQNERLILGILSKSYQKKKIKIALNIREEATALTRNSAKWRALFRELFHGCFTITILVKQRPFKNSRRQFHKETKVRFWLQFSWVLMKIK